MTLEDELFFSMLWRRHYPILLKYSRLLLQDESLEKEAVDEVFYMAINKLPELRVNSNPAGWLLNFLKSTILRLMEEDASLSAFSTPEKTTLTLSRVSPSNITEWDNLLLTARYIMRLTISDICTASGISESKCTMDLYDARRRVEARLRQQGHPSDGRDK